MIQKMPGVCSACGVLIRPVGGQHDAYKISNLTSTANPPPQRPYVLLYQKRIRYQQRLH
jgi:hypothetical protein